MELYLIIIGALVVGYLIVAYKMSLFPFKGKVIGGVGTIAKEFERLRIPVPLFKVITKTPSGVQVRSTVEVSGDVLNDIDEGLSRQIVRYNLKYPDWGIGRRHSEYSVLLIDPMVINAENDPGSPALLVQGQQAAGTCIRDGGEKLVHVVAPHQQAQNWRFHEYFKTTIWFESEHCRLNWNDTALYDHFQGQHDIHPFVP